MIRLKRLILRAMCLAIVGGAIGGHAAAPTFPAKPIRLLVPFPAGGPNDILARALADELSRQIGQNVLADNRPGASGNIAAEAAARSVPDGYTLFWAQSATHGVNPALFAGNVKFDPINDFAAIGLVGRMPIVMITAPATGLKSIRDVLQRAQARPGHLTYGSGGHGTTPHMAGELLKSNTGVKLTHIPYKGSQPAIADALAGRVDVAFDGVASAVGYIRSGQLLALGVSTGERLPQLPDIAPIAESVPGYDIASWSGLAAPVHTPVAVIERLNKELNRALGSPGLRERFSQLGVTPLGGSPAEMAQLVRDEIQKWSKVVAQNGIRVE